MFLNILLQPEIKHSFSSINTVKISHFRFLNILLHEKRVIHSRLWIVLNRVLQKKVEFLKYSVTSDFMQFNSSLQKLTQLTFNHKLQINEPQVQFQYLKTLLHL